MGFKLYPYQELAVAKLKTGSILCGGVGSGKSLTALAYFYTKVCGGKMDKDGLSELMTIPRDLYVITTAAKRNSLDWEREAAQFGISPNREASILGVGLKVDSWNNLHKYTKIKGAFFIFDEQRAVGSGSWTKAFLKIAKLNDWILLSATPGDTWMDYIPAFVANGFYKNRSEFIRRHVVYNTFTKYPKVDRYVETNHLIKLKNSIMVAMDYIRPTKIESKVITVDYDEKTFKKVAVDRWDIYDNRPVKEIGELCHLMRKVVNTDPSRLEVIKALIQKHRKVIIFYTFNYELDLLLQLREIPYLEVGEYNGHSHDPIPKGESWVYLVQYMAGAEGWNCIETNTIIFYSHNYSYRMTVQAAGRVDRLNTPFTTLYYYHLTSDASIDVAIRKALKSKKDFNEKSFERRQR